MTYSWKWCRPMNTIGGSINLDIDIFEIVDSV